MDDTDKIVAATLAAARCATAGYKSREEYVAEYEAFFHLVRERTAAAAMPKAREVMEVYRKLAES